MSNTTPAKLTIDTGRAQYVRYGYIREISSTAIILTTPQSERFASSQIPLCSVVDLEDATPEQVEANPGRINLRREASRALNNRVRDDGEPMREPRWDAGGFAYDPDWRAS